MRSTSVYVHFPWCLRKCPYCDFNSHATAREAVPDRAYADAVLAELSLRSEATRGRRLSSVFFGGGTPSLWAPRELGRVLSGIRESFGVNVAEDLEVTVECNPTSLDAQRAAALRAEGVNRLSIGVQSLDRERLRFLGRLHDDEGALHALRQARSEVDRVSVDLMFGMSGQSPRDFVSELDRVFECEDVDHVSAYALTVEPGTQFGALHKKGRLPLATDDGYAETFLAIEAALGARGLEHYEVSNYARPGFESKHNRHYWRGGEYLGLGAGAVGCTHRGSAARRWKSEPRPERYLAESGSESVEVWFEELSPQDRVREALMLGLRTREGVDLRRLAADVDLDPKVGRERALERRIERGDLLLEGDSLRVPTSRWLALDAIVTDLF